MAVTIHKDDVSWGVLALILCLALPMGILSRFAPRTTADEVDAAGSVVVARVTAMQAVANAGVTLLQFELDHSVAGIVPKNRFQLRVQGGLSLEVGDLVLAMLSLDPPGLHGAYQLRKDPRSLEYLVHTPISGLAAEGLYGSGPLPLDQVEDAVRRRLGLGARSPRRTGGSASSGDLDGEDGPSGPAWSAGGDDHGNSTGTATPVQLKLPHLLTGMPTLVDGFLEPGDVDFFSFDAPVLSLLHAQTQAPEGLTSIPPDTFMGLFSAWNGELLAYDDDSGEGNFSSFIVPIEETGSYAVAVEGAPDPDLSFTGRFGEQTGPYVLSLELQQAAYLANFSDLIVGVSPDGTFIEDYVGFKRVNGLDVLRDGLEGDGWGIEYDVLTAAGQKHVYAGSGDFLTPPSFTDPVNRSLFSLSWYQDNRRGQSNSQTTVPYQSDPLHVVGLAHSYRLLLHQSVVTGTLAIEVANQDRIRDAQYRRLMDVDLFGVGDDVFHWSFQDGSDSMVYPVAVTDSLDDLPAPPQPSGREMGDRQVALIANVGTLSGGSFQAPVTVRFPVSFTLVDEFMSAQDAVQSAVQNLLATDAQSWTVAVDADPSTGLYTAFGVGLGHRYP